MFAHRRPALDGLHVLVVDDVWDILEVFTLLLRAEGAQVTAAATGREAFELVRQRDFDVVLTDLGLPDMPGDALIRLIRDSGHRRARVVAVTGFSEPYITRALQAGADVVFTKPVEWTQILHYLGRPGLAASA